MGANPAVGDKDVYVHIVGNVPDGWTMVGGKWTGADYIDIGYNPLLNKADCEYQFTKSLTQINKVSVGQNSNAKDVSIYHLTVDDNGTLESGEYRIFFENADTYYVPSYYNLSVSDEPVEYSFGEIKLPLEISPEATSVSFSCTAVLNGVDPDEVTFALHEGSVNGTSDSTFSPNDGCTRGQIVTFLYRFFVK